MATATARHDPSAAADATGTSRRRAPSGGLTWAATGHRPDKLGGYGDDVRNRLVALACDFLILSAPCLMFVGMALGWDTAMAEACVMCKVPFVAAVPFEGQEKAWPFDSQERYRRLLSKAERVHIVSLDGYHRMVMHLRNIWMVDRAQAIVALWNGMPGGGTSHCVRYAEDTNKSIMNLWDQFVSRR